jgi:hypothetical protein
MLRRFRNKLKTLSDQDFLDKLIHHDVYPHKYYAAMEQEARNRFFSNRYFNGEDDEYINPDSFQPTLATRRNIVAGTVMLLAVAVLSFVLLYLLNFNDFSSIRAVFVDRADKSLNTSAKPSPDKNTIATTATTAGDKANESNKITAPSNNKNNPDQIIDKESATTTDAVPEVITVAKQKKYLEWEASYRPLYVIPEKQVISVATAADVEENTPASAENNQLLAQNMQQEIEKAASEKTVTETAATPKQEIIKPEPAPETKVAVAEETPKTEPAAVAIKEPISDYSNVSQLTVPQLRKFIPFINDWAYQQTQRPGIKDYYIENNSLVNLVLTRDYSDSLAAFQQQKPSQMLNRYYGALKTVLGEDFPRVRIEIKFLKYNADL